MWRIVSSQFGVSECFLSINLGHSFSGRGKNVCNFMQNVEIIAFLKT